MRRAQHIEQDEAVLAARELLSVADLGDPESDFERADTPELASAARRFAPEVDRRPRLRAR
ncbi:MAG TPA: hypothetical protein VJT74_17275 [Pyrinomonadaceae bacterium]|nr:hypothetical protein [Pyrinomonadaceae bacterium]